MIDALKSGKYDINKVALLMSQTGGGCRASNYIHLLRKALIRNNLAHIPVVSFSVSGLENNPGFKLTFPIIYQLLAICFYGDVLMDVSNQTRPYEINRGDTDNLVSKWVKIISGKPTGLSHFKKIIRQIMDDFSKIPVKREQKIKVGVVGEIYVKYAPLGNNNLEQFLHDEGVEVVVPGLMGFLLYTLDNVLVEARVYGMGKLRAFIYKRFLAFILGLEKKIISVMKEYADYRPLEPFYDKKKHLDGFVSDRNCMGEGWLLTAEMIELIHTGVPNIVCTQPFGCLPNHIVGKGMIRAIRKRHPDANIVAIDYDPGATRVNQENRIKLMLANGYKM
jgi:predicted nucleotide-binding protein (sugar kinase/HSP70/actin superfamily)